jgi:hypothetical protein
MPTVWNTRPEKLFVTNFQGYIEDIEAALYALMLSYAPRIEAWMKENAAWTDRTGNARQSLWAEAAELVSGAYVAFDHGVAYGFWLEYANQGRYQIIAPALDKFSAEIWADVQRLFK